MFVGVSNSRFTFLYSINNNNKCDVHVLFSYNALDQINIVKIYYIYLFNIHYCNYISKNLNVCIRR